ncbi:hypothetical protein [Desulfobacter hydrogenophilus]|uniref:Transposase n=1 Tax=Desulfobacter hydrogenophilus TaxID=2291 RepID=A0ABX5RII5_9BACT|nr:hypothetical protein [Desulfobacter hydrogenophilus]NDY74617.1 hypothetical protein [Desulfobacter hydrogenophilus]QBH14285.1 hypothetical protein EYB58_16005 [Desulfobacter hydrogenophilus]
MVSHQQINLKKIKSSLISIGMALHASHGLLATDDPSAKEEDAQWESWRIDHSKEVSALEFIESLFSDTDTCPLCGNRKNDL